MPTAIRPIAPIIDDAKAFALFAPIAAAPFELCAVAYLDPEWRLIGARHTPSDRPDAVTVPVREILRDALMLNARNVIMAHNHPSGMARSSGEDVRLTRRLARALDAIGVTLLDHLILTTTGGISLRRDAML